jgi:hypothetical protein
MQTASFDKMLVENRNAGLFPTKGLQNDSLGGHDNYVAFRNRAEFREFLICLYNAGDTSAFSSRSDGAGSATKLKTRGLTRFGVRGLCHLGEQLRVLQRRRVLGCH